MPMEQYRGGELLQVQGVTWELQEEEEEEEEGVLQKAP